MLEDDRHHYLITVYHWHRKLCTRQAGEQWRIAHTR